MLGIANTCALKIDIQPDPVGGGPLSALSLWFLRGDARLYHDQQLTLLAITVIAKPL